MRDKDTHMLVEKYESLFAGKIEEEEDTSLGAQDKDEEKDEDKEEKSEDSEESKDDDSEDSSDDSDDSDDDKEDDDSDSDDESDDYGDSKSEAGGDSGIQSKVKQLQKQYNDLLVDAFEKYAAECIENALDGVESSFGENIQDILDQALQELKGKILGDLGVEDAGSCPMGGGMDMGGGMEMDLGDEPDVKFGSEVGGIPTISVDTEDGPEDDEAEAEESEEEDEVEEACGMKKHKKGKKVVKESTEADLAADFYGFV